MTYDLSAQTIPMWIELPDSLLKRGKGKMQGGEDLPSQNLWFLAPPYFHNLPLSGKVDRVSWFWGEEGNRGERHWGCWGTLEARWILLLQWSNNILLIGTNHSDYCWGTLEARWFSLQLSNRILLIGTNNFDHCNQEEKKCLELRWNRRSSWGKIPIWN